MSATATTLDTLRKSILSKVAAQKSAAVATPTDPNVQPATIPAQMPESRAGNLDLPPSSSPTNPQDINMNGGDSPPLNVTKPEGGSTNAAPSAQVVDEMKQKAAGIMSTLEAIALRKAAPAAAESGKAAAAAPAAPAASGPAPTEAETAEAVKMAFASIGASLCEDEEGRQLVQDYLTKKAGAQATAQLLTDADTAARILAVQAADQMAKQAAAAEEEQAIHEHLAAMTPDQRESTLKFAHVLGHERQFFATPEDAYFFMKGAAAMQAGLDQAGGALPEEIPGGQEGMPAPEDILEMIVQMLQSGQIAPEEAMQMAQEAGIELPPELLASIDPAAAAAADPAAAEAAKQANVDVYNAFDAIQIPAA